jgi:hypothetical protein
LHGSFSPSVLHFSPIPSFVFYKKKNSNYNICFTNYGRRYARAHTPFEKQCSWYLNCSKFRRTLIRLAAQYSLQKSQIHNLHEFVRTFEAPHQASTRSDIPINKFKLRKHIHINELVFHILWLSFNYDKLIKRIQLWTYTNQIISILTPQNLLTQAHAKLPLSVTFL